MLLEALAVALISGQASAPQLPGDRGGPQRVAPRGSYTQTCSGSYVNQGRLYADCRDERGRVRGTSILLSLCGNYEVRNIDGRLTCGPNRGDYEDDNGRPDRPGRPGRPDRPGGPGGPGWPGGPGGPGNGWNRSSIDVYSDAYYRGRSARFTEAVPNLVNSGLNDEISSIRVQGSWEVCTDAYFRGRCQVISDDVINLANWGINDRISSLRPANRGW